MIPLRAIPTLAISLCALAFVAWMAAMSLRGSLYADPSPELRAAASASAPATTHLRDGAALNRG